MVERRRPGGQMTLLDHLDELRTVLLQSLLVAVAAAVGAWFVSQRLLDLIVAPMTEAGQQVYFSQPTEAFMTRMKVAGVAGLIVVLPFVLLRVYRFVAPGLYPRERKLVTPLLIASVVLFYTGVAFAFLVMIPLVVKFMLGYATESVRPLIGIGPYFSFVAQTCLAFGLVFELPVAVLLLSAAGLVGARTLWAGWRYAAVIIVVVAAVLTPPDVVSQMLMAVPVMALYLLSVGAALLLERGRRRSAAAAGRLPEDAG
ncbi:MAG: twin-arginine translocase subunit TatC [Candidatus Latescibacteria bacterium]|nr:twin-arginine translocase subunit TatC [Candidatus Latescibacterota bacterium]